MSSFEKMFRKSRGRPVQYKGDELHLVDYFPFKQGDRVMVTFEGASSEWRQGVRMKVSGALEVAGQRLSVPVTLWEDTAPTATEVLILAPSGHLEVANVWDTGDGVTHFWHNGAAMIIEELPLGRRYHCNDGHPDEDFDDIVFRLESLPDD